MTDPSVNPDPATQEQPALVYSEMAERPEPIYEKNLSVAMVLAAVGGPLGLFYADPAVALLLLATVFVATFINLDNAETAWLLANAASVIWAHYVVTKHNSKATVRGHQD